MLVVSEAYLQSYSLSKFVWIQDNLDPKTHVLNHDLPN